MFARVFVCLICLCDNLSVSVSVSLSMSVSVPMIVCLSVLALIKHLLADSGLLRRTAL